MREELFASQSCRTSPSTHSWTDQGDAPASGLWRELRGSVKLTHYLWAEDDGASEEEHDAGIFRLDDASMPVPRELDDAFFLAVVPESVRAPTRAACRWWFSGTASSRHPRTISAPNDPNATVELLDRWSHRDRRRVAWAHRERPAGRHPWPWTWTPRSRTRWSRA